MELTVEEERLLRDTRAPEPLLLAPPAPSWPENCHAWRALAQSSLHAPKLEDSAPEGTKVGSLDPRLLFHGHLRTVITPAIAKAKRLVAEQVMANRERRHGKAGVILDGPRGTGKSTVLQAIGVHWERRLSALYGPDENRIPVIVLSVPSPSRGSMRNWAGAFARFLGQERESGDPTESVIRAMRNARTLLVLIDGIERLRTAADAELAFQYLDVISEETGATFVYCGRGAQFIVDPLTRDNDTGLDPEEQLRGDHMVLRTSRMGFSDEESITFARVIDLFDAELVLYRHQPHDLRKVAENLHTRSRGYMRSLSQLICQAAQIAIRSGEERITLEVLEDVSLGRVVHL
ncbi:ATP-binding protein [Streptomyces nigrescens]|uniref:ATP-binding protein n=1 Tax=Streptomyces platensis TaxID=58346 RepID=UPI002E167837|nr:ATP-binding protein [Streptomyces platensis]